MVDVRNFKRPESKGTSSKGINTPQNNPEVTNDQEENYSAEAPEETNRDLIKEYLAYLEREDIHKEDIMAVLDSIISTGNVYWNFQLFEQIPVSFRIRPAWVNNLLTERMDRNPPKTFSHFSEIVGIYNLAGSLVSYGDYRFDLNTEEDFYSAKKFIQNLPFIIQSHLIKKMAIFDRVISVATSDWAAENFTKPQPEK